MAVLSDYSVGSISIANGATAVTGIGTAWTLQSFQEGDEILIDNLIAIAAGPATTATSIPITRPWTGGTKTAIPYRIRYMADGSRYTAIGQALVNLLGDGLLAAISALGGGVDKLAYYTGVSTLALTDFKTKGRSIAASDTTLNLLTKLGPVFGSPAVAPSFSDVGLSDGNFDDITYPGVYSIGGNWTNGTNGAGSAGYSGLLEVYVRGNGFYQQIYRSVNNTVWRRWTATLNATSWPNPWVVMEQPTLGTVSQSSGNPTGSIIERGSNANGDYVRYADGTQICWVRQATTITTVASAGIFRDTAAIAWVFPIAFSVVPVISLEMVGSTNLWASPNFNNGSQLSSGTVFAVGAFTASGATFQGIAIGRWF